MHLARDSIYHEHAHKIPGSIRFGIGNRQSASKVRKCCMRYLKLYITTFLLTLYLGSPVMLSVCNGCWLIEEWTSVHKEWWQTKTEVSGTQKTFLTSPNYNRFLQKRAFYMLTYMYTSERLSVLHSVRQRGMLIKPSFFSVGKPVNCFHIILNRVKLQTIILKRFNTLISARTLTDNQTIFTRKFSNFKLHLLTKILFQILNLP
jgi:hypothetical protein